MTENAQSSDSKSGLETIVSQKTSSISEESAKSKTSKQHNGTNSQGKSLKKPDKVLACPRCSSMDTKFCYHNNYNASQPRHFCKACQRYWTAGGTMRNVPVGAGRRKSKSSTSHYRHITISQALQASHIYPPNGIHSPTLKSNGKVLGIETPACDSLVELGDTNMVEVLNGSRNGFHKLQEMRNVVLCKSPENGDHSGSNSKSSATVSDSVEDGSRRCKQQTLMNGFTSPHSCLLGVPWPYAWSYALIPPGAFCPQGFPMSFYPAPYWNGDVAWHVPSLSPQSSSSSNSPTSCSSTNSPKLGKHSRDSETAIANGFETHEETSKTKNGCALVPKILRVHDPCEAAKSSIWATLGIKNEISATGLSPFKGSQSKSDHKEHVPEASAVLRANPAALSRSISFQECS